MQCVFLPSFFSLVTTHTNGSRTACTAHIMDFLERENRNPPLSLHSLAIIFLSLRNQSQNKDPDLIFFTCSSLSTQQYRERNTQT